MKKIDTLECYIDGFDEIVFAGKFWKRKNQTIRNTVYATVLSVDMSGDNKINLKTGDTHSFKFKIGSKEKKLSGTVYVLNHNIRSIIIVSMEGLQKC